jgi:hypothetical protein
MISQDPTDPARRTYTDPARPVTIEDERGTDPLRPSNSRRGLWGIGALVVIVLIMAAIAYRNWSPASPTATGPSTTQSAPSTTGQGGAPNTGAAR